MPSGPHPGRLLELSGAYWQTCTLHAAVELDLFTAIGGALMNSRRIAALLQTNERALSMLLNALCAMGLLRKENDRFGNTEESRLFLDRSSERYQGHIILHHHHLMPSWTRLHEAVRSGRSVRERATLQEEETRKHFLMGMFNLATGLAPRVAAALDLSDRRRLLDLGGGPGTYAIHFCQRYPQLQAVVFDLPTTQPFAEETISRFGLGDRIAFSAGDYFKTPLPGGFDVVWMSHILHAEGPDACRRLINRAVAALGAGGRMIIHDFFLEATMDRPLFATLFALNMLLGTDAGQAYSFQQVEAMMAEAGLEDLKRMDVNAPNDSALLIGTRPSFPEKRKDVP